MAFAAIPKCAVRRQKIEHGEHTIVRFTQELSLHFKEVFVAVVLEHCVFLLLAVDLGKTQAEVCIKCVTERRVDGLIKRSCTAFQTNLQKRTFRNGAAFPVIMQAAMAVAVLLCEAVRPAPTAAALDEPRRLFHEGFHAVALRCCGEVHHFLLVVEIEKAATLCKSRLCKNRIFTMLLNRFQKRRKFPQAL